jgi:hypothetical protein
MTRKWRKPNNEELKDLYSPPKIVWVIKIEKKEMGGTCSTYEGEERVLVEKPEGKRPLGRPRHKWEDNIKVDLQEVGLGGIDWIDLAQDRDRWRAIVKALMNL